jgi:dipeptidase E
MLLTSAGIRNEPLKSALVDLLGRPLAAAAIVVISTAAIADAGDHGWLVENLSRLHGFGWRRFQVLELNALPAGMILERLRGPQAARPR